MKNTVILLLAMSLLWTFVSCSSDKSVSEPDYLPPIKAEIPAELQDNPEAVEYINNTTEVLNEFSRELEDLFVKIEPYAHKEESELSPMEKLKVTKHTLKFTGQMARLGARMATMKETYQLMSDDLSEDEQKALEVINDTFMKRIRELNEKYDEIDNIEVEEGEMPTASDTSEV